MVLSGENLKRPPERWTRMGSVTRTFIRKAHPALFTIIMATGIISMLFSSFPYGEGSSGMMVASLVFFFINLSLLCAFTLCFVAKHTMYPDRWSALMRKPLASLYLGAFPMGACTLLNISVEVLHFHYGFGGRSFIYLLWSLWWIIVIIGGLCCWAGVHAMATLQKHSLRTMAPSWLLPVTTLTVVSSCGGILANALQTYSPRHALITTVTSVFLVTAGLCLGLMVLTLYLARLIIHGLPSGGSILSVFLPLGTTGQSGFAFYLAGKNMKLLLPFENGPGASALLKESRTGEIIHVVCMCAAFILWTLATTWMLFALLALQTSLLKSRPPFAMGFWGLVFPNGVYANLTITLGKTFNSKGFLVYGSVYAIIVLGLWVFIAGRSLFQLEVVLARPLEPDNEGQWRLDLEDTMELKSKGSDRSDTASTLGNDFDGEDLDYPPWNYDFGDVDVPVRPWRRSMDTDTEVGLYTS